MHFNWALTRITGKNEGIYWERISWRAALQKGSWGCWSAAGSAGVSRVPGQPRGQTSGLYHQLLKLDSYPSLFSLTLSTVQFWAHDLRIMSKSLNPSRGQHQSWCQGSNIWEDRFFTKASFCFPHKITK